MKTYFQKILSIAVWLIVAYLGIASASAQTLWVTAKSNKDVLKISTLFTAQDVRDFLSNPSGLDNAVNWCKQTGITRVFIESFRGGYYADHESMIQAKERFLKEGFDVAGCVTTVKVGKPGAGGWGMTSCYTNKKSTDELEKIFKETASIFDLIMIDDFLFTECGCEDCVAARGDHRAHRAEAGELAEAARAVRAGGRGIGPTRGAHRPAPRAQHHAHRTRRSGRPTGRPTAACR